MEKIQIVVEGSEKEIQQMIETNTKGWRLFFIEPSGAEFIFLNPFWGRKWNGTPENLKELILEGDFVNGHHKHCIVKFMLDGKERFAFCTWTKQVYDFNTKKYYQLEGNKLARKITDLIVGILEVKCIGEYY